MRTILLLTAVGILLGIAMNDVRADPVGPPGCEPMCTIVGDLFDGCKPSCFGLFGPPGCRPMCERFDPAPLPAVDAALPCATVDALGTVCLGPPSCRPNCMRVVEPGTTFVAEILA